MRGNVPQKAREHSDRAKKQGGPRPTPHKKTCGFACAFLAEIQPKKLPIRQYGEIFSADFISKIHWQNCFAPKKSKFCAKLRRDGAGMLTHGKTAQRRSPCKICLLRRMFSYAESAKAALLGAKGMLCYGSGISLLSKSVLSSIEVRESPNFLMRERSWSSCCVSRTAKRSSALNSPTT